MSAGKAFLILHGKQALNEDVRAAVEQQRAAGRELAVRLTWEAGDAQRLVREALEGGYSQLIAGGGDGTLRDICEAMALADTEASLVLLPLGTANDFARAAGVPLEPGPALALLDAPARAIDLGEADGKLFLNMATGGFGSQVTANTSEDLKKVLGGAAYLFTGLSRFSELHAAYAWQLCLDCGNGSAVEQAEFAVWYAASEEHARAWLQLGMLDQRFSNTSIPVRNALLAPRDGVQQRIRKIGSGLASVALVCGLAVFAGKNYLPLGYWMADQRTATGEQRQLRLADGTVLDLNTHSAVDVQFDITV